MAAMAPAMAQCAAAGNGGVDIIGQGIFETGGSAFKFPVDASTNFDSVDIGNDNALAIGGAAQIGVFGTNTADVTAQNNLKIRKNQDSGNCCSDSATKYNVEQITAGSRSATAIGIAIQGSFPFGTNTASTLAQNNVEITSNQQ